MLIVGRDNSASEVYIPYARAFTQEGVEKPLSGWERGLESRSKMFLEQPDYSAGLEIQIDIIEHRAGR
ncbi:MAG: hypothetical protein Kow0088_22380 [Anaerolineales bacterium]